MNNLGGSQLGLVLSLFESYSTAKANYDAAFKKYQDYIAYANEINRQMNEKFSQNDPYNGNILKNKLTYEIYPEQDRLGQVQTLLKAVMVTAEQKYLTEKAKLSAAEQATALAQADAAAAASIAQSNLVTAQANAQLQGTQSKISAEEQAALRKKIITYSIAGLALITVAIVGIWAYRKYVKK